MLYFANWKVLLICGVCALGVLFSLPNLFTPAQLGGSAGLSCRTSRSASASICAAARICCSKSMSRRRRRERLNAIIDNVRNALRDAKIGYTGLNVEGDAIVFTIRDADRIEDARRRSPRSIRTLTRRHRRRRRRDDAFSARRPSSGAARRSTSRSRSSAAASTRPAPRSRRSSGRAQDRILVELPGVDNPEHVKALLGRTAKLTFQLVDTSDDGRGSPTRPAAARRRDPAGAGTAAAARRSDLCRASAGSWSAATR